MRHTNKTVIFAELILLLSAYLLSASLFQRNDSFDEYTLTRAMCEGTTCRDYTIRCADNGTMIAMVPLTGFVTFPGSWKDTRNLTSLCL